MTNTTSLLARAGELTKTDGLGSAREKLTLMALADVIDRNTAPNTHVGIDGLMAQTIQSKSELRSTVRALARLGLLSFVGFGYDDDGATVLVGVTLHLPEASI